MAVKYCKNQTGNICTKLPPTSDAYGQHCRRAWKQVFEWKKAFEPYDLVQLYDVNDFGYQRKNTDELSIRWTTIPPEPKNKCLVKCLKCTNGCRNCKCAKNGVPCTPQCGCSSSVCTNRPKDLIDEALEVDQAKLMPKSTAKKIPSFDDYSDEDVVSQSDFKKPFDIEVIDSDESFSDLSVENQNDPIFDVLNAPITNSSDYPQVRFVEASIFYEHNYFQQSPAVPRRNQHQAERRSRIDDFHPYQTAADITTEELLGEQATINSAKRKRTKDLVNVNGSSSSTPTQIVHRKKHNT